MAKLECTLQGSKNTILHMIDQELLNGSFTASYEDGSDFVIGNVQCAVRVYERYSAVGGNRLSLNITLFGSGENWRLSAIAAGGSQALVFKINTWGEEAFLEQLTEIIRPFRV